jgi:hypothetical protein
MLQCVSFLKLDGNQEFIKKYRQNADITISNEILPQEQGKDPNVCIRLLGYVCFPDKTTVETRELTSLRLSCKCLFSIRIKKNDLI